MRKLLIFSTLGIIAGFLLIAIPGFARDFSPDDFDPADPSLAESYGEAVVELIEEMTIAGEDENGDPLFKAIPFPLELVALMTQLEIHESNITDPVEIDMLLADQNNMKPAMNSFAFVLDGYPSWVEGSVYMAYTSDDHPDGVYLDVFNAGIDPVDDTTATATWAVAMEDVQQMQDFMDADNIYIIVQNTDASLEPIFLDCGFWRLWGLFDIRDEPGASDLPVISESGNQGDQEGN